MKWYGKIGFVTQEETSPGIWENVSTEKSYYGEISNMSRSWKEGSDLNDDVTISNKLTIVTDPYIIENLINIRYVIYLGVKWKVTGFSIEYPRLILSLGGIYGQNTT